MGGSYDVDAFDLLVFFSFVLIPFTFFFLSLTHTGPPPLRRLLLQAAEDADEGGLSQVEFAAVNCVNEHAVCNDWFGIRAYPTFLAVNDRHGTRQV